MLGVIFFLKTKKEVGVWDYQAMWLHSGPDSYIYLFPVFETVYILWTRLRNVNDLRVIGVFFFHSTRFPHNQCILLWIDRLHTRVQSVSCSFTKHDSHTCYCFVKSVLHIRNLAPVKVLPELNFVFTVLRNLWSISAKFCINLIQKQSLAFRWVMQNDVTVRPCMLVGSDMFSVNERVIESL